MTTFYKNWIIKGCRSRQYHKNIIPDTSRPKNANLKMSYLSNVSIQFPGKYVAYWERQIINLEQFNSFWDGQQSHLATPTNTFKLHLAAKRLIPSVPHRAGPKLKAFVENEFDSICLRYVTRPAQTLWAFSIVYALNEASSSHFKH